MKRPFNGLRRILNLLRGKSGGTNLAQMPPQSPKTVESDGLVTVNIPQADFKRSAVEVLIGRRDRFPDLDRGVPKPKGNPGTEP
jgi:hypothetical protein